ncbi:hypothetical protein B0H10DRAFT_1938742 [Mycena sp. CBHHK59/15]|nr:hypothetical protein B0H10DRAFT_1938742 [Mycena sp. CBHHK59/15]
MLFNFSLAIIAAVLGAGLVASEPANEQRLRCLGRVVVTRETSCQSDNDCDGSSAFGPGEGSGIGSYIHGSGCHGGNCQALGTGGSCDAQDQRHEWDVTFCITESSSGIPEQRNQKQDGSVYAGLRQFYQGKGFDPYSQDTVARHLGYPLYQLSYEPDAPFAHVQESNTLIEAQDLDEEVMSNERLRE